MSNGDSQVAPSLFTNHPDCCSFNGRAGSERREVEFMSQPRPFGSIVHSISFSYISCPKWARGSEMKSYTAPAL